jgi:hypothetical protein
MACVPFFKIESKRYRKELMHFCGALTLVASGKGRFFIFSPAMLPCAQDYR